MLACGSACVVVLQRCTRWVQAAMAKLAADQAARAEAARQRERELAAVKVGLMGAARAGGRYAGVQPR